MLSVARERQISRRPIAQDHSEEFDHHPAANFCSLKKSLRGAHDQIFVAARDRWVVTREIDPPRLPVDVDLIVERNWSDQRLNFMKAVAATAEDLQREIDLCWSENLHCAHFNCHVESLLCHSDRSGGISTVSRKY